MVENKIKAGDILINGKGSKRMVRSITYSISAPTNYKLSMKNDFEKADPKNYTIGQITRLGYCITEREIKRLNDIFLTRIRIISELEDWL